MRGGVGPVDAPVTTVYKVMTKGPVRRHPTRKYMSDAQLRRRGTGRDGGGEKTTCCGAQQTASREPGSNECKEENVHQHRPTIAHDGTTPPTLTPTSTRPLTLGRLRR